MQHFELINHVYVINLQNREDRRKQWLGNLKYMPSFKDRFEFFNAIDGSIVNIKTSLRQGELGCSMSHVAIWKDAMIKGYKYILVFEDDAVVNVDFEQRIEESLNSCEMNFDWLYLFNSWDFRPVEHYNDNLNKVIASLGTVAYILNVSAVYRLLPYVEEFRFPVDVVMGHMSFLSKVYRPKQIFVVHNDNSPSNVRDSSNLKLNYWFKIKKIIRKVFFL